MTATLITLSSAVIQQPMPDGTFKEMTVRTRAREIIDKMQEDNAVIFVSRASFDGMRNMYTTLVIEQENVGAFLRILSSY